MRGNRFFARVPKELREETKNSVYAELFRPVVEGSLHHSPTGGLYLGGQLQDRRSLRKSTNDFLHEWQRVCC